MLGSLLDPDQLGRPSVGQTLNIGHTEGPQLT